MRSLSVPDELLTVTQAAEILDRPTRTIHHWISTGKVAAVKIGDGRTSAYVITRAEVERLKAGSAA